MVYNKKQTNEKEFLINYNPEEFEKPSVSVDNVIFSIFESEKKNYRKDPEKNLYILLVKRGEYPFIDKWALPGGFVRMNENLEESVHRELEEKTNLKNVYMEQLYTFSEINRDPRMRVISVAYMVLIKAENQTIIAKTDAKEVSWFKFSYEFLENKELLIRLENNEAAMNITLNFNNKKYGEKRIEITESGGLAFDHAKIIGYALLRLRNKVEYTNLVFNLMPEYFTLTELQKVYEIILGKKLIKANFRRKIKDLVTETEKFTEEAGHRPSKLFKLNSKIIDI